MQNNYSSFSDAQLVDGIINNDKPLIDYFFNTKCAKLISYIVVTVFDHRVEGDELANELFLYLAENDWYKLRQFDFRSKLTTWVSVVAVRFFQKKRSLLIENSSSEPLLNNRIDPEFYQHDIWSNGYDIHNAIKHITNERYQMVIQKLDLDGQKPDDVAKELGITIANLYNVRHRAHVQLASLLGKKEDWYD